MRRLTWGDFSKRPAKVKPFTSCAANIVSSSRKFLQLTQSRCVRRATLQIVTVKKNYASRAIWQNRPLLKLHRISNEERLLMKQWDIVMFPFNREKRHPAVIISNDEACQNEDFLEVNALICSSAKVDRLQRVTEEVLD